MKSVKRVAYLAVLSSLLSACVSAPPPVSMQQPESVPTSQPPAAITPPVEPAPPTSVIPDVTVPPLPTLPLPQPTKTPVTASMSEAQGRALLQQLLPTNIKDRNGWRDDILSAFTGLKIPYEAQYFCAAMAIIEQESSWQSDPSVPNLDKIVWKEIEKRAQKYHLPLMAVKLALLKPSPDGRSYKERIDALTTEKQMNAVIEDLATDAGKLGLPMGMRNPIRTGGPMQVSVDFAEGHVRVWPYPYNRKSSIREEVFSRRGGLYFGIADLLQYRVTYPEMIYRFADFNAGRYSSRNAAFQAAVGVLSMKKMVLDGDLLTYNSDQTSITQQQLIKLSKRLALQPATIAQDLQQEKTEAFGQTMLFRRVFQLAALQTGDQLPQQVMPQIRLVSPKITRKLTTEWFAKKVNGRYQSCLGRQGVRGF